MFKKLLIIFCFAFIFNINIIKAESLTLNEITDELKNSSIVSNKVNQNHKVNISNSKNELIIMEEYNNNKYETIFEYNDNTLTYSSNSNKEELKESTIWIDEITKIVLSKFNYNENVINNLNIKNYTFEENGLEGARNSYIKDNVEIYYYFYYKISLSKISIDDSYASNSNTIISNEENTTTNEIKEDNSKEEETNTNEKKDNLSSSTFYIEIFCMIIGVLMLILNSATKN